MAQQIDINFAPTSLARSLRGSAWPIWALALSGLLLCLSAVFYWQGLQSKRALLRGEIASLEGQLEARLGRVIAAPREPLTQTQVLAMNAITAQLNLPWSETLNAMEAAAGQGSQGGKGSKTGAIALLELDPDPKNKLIKGLAEARDSQAMLGYIERLKRQAAFAGARLLKHEYTEQDASTVIRFEFEVIWPGRAP
ncbi:hypothetical protein LNV08_09115 [Paucibacter sp. TC2R-5]|uniref:hypothetical protein n=1 Tax=Paucibacter sp. TC2R-5 TaxID=2893555 RepID=UPI0021E4C68C|nr:hypothetical protein [Paucibacter sp. TC2R-5]MCV2359135.1 hypothetical protein [Paucibacter sp. TC2R-5]